jgi:hypothetical protein
MHNSLSEHRKRGVVSYRRFGSKKQIILRDKSSIPNTKVNQTMVKKSNAILKQFMETKYGYLSLSNVHGLLRKMSGYFHFNAFDDR